MTRRLPLRLLALAALLASGPAAAQVWPAPGDGFDWQAVGDRPVKAKHLAFDDLDRLWAASGTAMGNSALLPAPDDPLGTWSITGSIRIPDRILTLGRDTVLVAESRIHRTVNAGATWDSVDTSCNVQRGAMLEVPAGTPSGPWGDLSGVLLAGRTGLCRSDDRGANWTLVPQSETSQFSLRIADALVLPVGHTHAGRLVVATSEGVWLSDEGRTLLSLRRADGPTMPNPEKLAVLPSGRLVATGVDPSLPHRRVRVSDDGGESWRETAFLPQPADGIPGDAWLAVVGPRTVVAIGGRGVVYRTDNDGETWAVVGRVPITDDALTSQHVLIGPQGRLYVAVTRAGSQATDAWVWRTSLPQAVADEAAPVRETLGVTVSPNPSFGGSVTVELRQASPSADVRAEVFDAVGRRVAVLHEGPSAGALSLDVDTSGWAPGVYTVRVTSGGAVSVETFTVVR